MYFLPYANFYGYRSEAIKSLIESLGLPSAGDFVMTDERAVEMGGVLIEKADLCYLLDVFTARRDAGYASMTDLDRWLNLTSTPIEGIRRITRRFESNGSHSYRGGGSPLTQLAISSLSEFLDVHDMGPDAVAVQVNNLHPDYMPTTFNNLVGGYFNIQICTKPYNTRSTRSVKLPATVFGVEVPFRPMGYAPSTGENFVNITDGETVVAQYYADGYPGITNHRVLNILFPINWMSVPAFEQVLARILDQVSRLSNSSNVSLDIDQLVRIKMATTRTTERHLETSVSSLESRVQQAARDYYAMGKELNDKKTQLAVYKAGIKDPAVFKETAERELEMIKGIPAITRMEVDRTGKKVKFRTEELHCVNPKTKKTHIIGKFQITINLEATNMGDALVWRNLDRRGSDQHHAPHVDSNGRACLGNMSEMLPEVLASGDIGIIALLAIQFIQSVNIDDVWGRKISSFPILKTKDDANEDGAVTTVAA